MPYPMKSNIQTAGILTIIIVGILTRVIPHVPNFVPVEGLTLFGAAYLKRKEFAYIMPVLLIYLSDLVINNTTARIYFTEHDGFIWFSNYMIYSFISLILIVLAGRIILKKILAANVVVSALAASIIFFLISNFGIWVHSTTFYSKDLSGLMTAYIAGLPFLKTSMISTLLFTCILFGAYEWFLKGSYAPEAKENV